MSDDLGSLKAHAEYGHLEGQDYDAVARLVDDYRDLLQALFLTIQAAGGTVRLSMSEIAEAQFGTIVRRDDLRTDEIVLSIQEGPLEIARESKG